MSHVRKCPKCGNDTFIRLLFVRAPWKCKNPNCQYEESVERMMSINGVDRLIDKEW